MGVNGRVMRTKLITAVVIVLFASLAIYSYTTQENKLQLQNVELKSRETKIKALNVRFDKLNTELDKLRSDKNSSDEQVKKLEEQRQQLEKEKQDLSSQLQAKLEAKSKLAQVSQAVVNTVTQTKTASAAPVVSDNRCPDIEAKLAALGVPEDQLAAAGQLAYRESTCNETVYNSIGACGAFQSLPCGKWGAPGTTQYYQGAIAYANSRYGGYNQALAHSLANNWY